ncbi:MAG: hypothetical protein LBN99_04195 [Oscillospiraceae bacterium]|jgi:hypothetical protein|nr:hypothetical protein [Oscillospiraceae bacterium]
MEIKDEKRRESERKLAEMLAEAERDRENGVPGYTPDEVLAKWRAEVAKKKAYAGRNKAV